MSLSEAALARRMNYLTASDVPAVLGINPHKTQFQVWAEKTGQGPPGDSDMSMTLGMDLEDGLLQRARRELGAARMIRNQWRVHGGESILAATCDALVQVPKDSSLALRIINANGSPDSALKPEEYPLVAPAFCFEHPVEAKTSGIMPGSPEDFDQWGEAGTNQVPDRVAVQTQVQMLCTENDVAFVPALLGRGMGYRLYRIPRDDKLLVFIIEHCNTWWERHVVGKSPPAVILPSDNDVARYMKRVPGKSTMIDMGLLQQWQDLKEKAKAVQSDLDGVEARIKVTLGDSEIGEAQGYGTVKYAEESAGLRCDVDTLRAEFPDVYTRVAKPTTRRVMRFKKEKKS